MPKTAKISISLPEKTLALADRERRSTGETRSEFFRRAVDQLMRQRRQRKAVESYVAGYVAEPEEDFEADRIDGLGQEALAGEPWD